MCDKGPTLMIDDDTYASLTPAELDQTLEKYA